MIVYAVSNEECTYAIKDTVEEAREAAREAWRDMVSPDTWSIPICEVDTADPAPQAWREVEVMHFEADYSEEDTDE